MYCEEAAYMDLKVFYEVVIPLLEMEEAILIMISTPVDSFNFFTQLLRMKNPNTGESVFLTYEADLVCERCAQTAHPEKCRHMLKYLPPWKSSDKLEIVSMILKDRETTLLRESMGVVTDEGGSLFPNENIDIFANELPVVLDERMYPSQLLITCDPNARDSRTSSEMALTAVFYERGTFTVSFLFFFFYFSIDSVGSWNSGKGKPHNVTYSALKSLTHPSRVRPSLNVPKRSLIEGTILCSIQCLHPSLLARG